MKNLKKSLLVVLFLLLAAGYIPCGGNGYSTMGPTAPSYMTPTVSAGPTPTPGGGGY